MRHSSPDYSGVQALRDISLRGWGLEHAVVSQMMLLLAFLLLLLTWCQTFFPGQVQQGLLLSTSWVVLLVLLSWLLVTNKI